MTVMESEARGSERETPPRRTWTSCKLIIDPALTNGLYRVYRHDGHHFNLPVEDLGLFPVDTVRDPRICRLWSRSRNTELVVPKFKVDEWYVGPIPPKEVTFSRLNDNVKEAFLTDMCQKYGNVDEVEIFYNPKNKKHLGLAKVIFDTVKAAKEAVQHLHQTSVMGNVIHVEIDPKGENRARYLQLLLNGQYTPWTLPVGSSEQALQSLIDNLLSNAAIQRLSIASSPASIATPRSLDTAFSSIWQDTPCSFGLTPRSLGTPHTPCLTTTPLSQDSCYSSLQATPVLQGEPVTHSVHKPSRQELWQLKPARRYRGSGTRIDLILKHYQQQTPQLLSDRQRPDSKQLAVWNGDSLSPAHDTRKPSFYLASPFEESGHTPNVTSSALPRNCSSFRTRSINATADLQATAAVPPDDDQPEIESLDSRIENLLTNLRTVDQSYIDGASSDGDGHCQDSPAPPSSALDPADVDDANICGQASNGSSSSRRQRPSTEVVDVSPPRPVDDEDDKTLEAVSFLTKNSECPSLSESSHFERRETEAARFPSRRLKDNHSPLQDKEHCNHRQSGVFHTSSFSSNGSATEHVAPKAPPAVPLQSSRPPGAPLSFPIPPFPLSVPPVPARLPNGSIPIPPPGWAPPPSRHTPIPIPPPIPPPPPSAAPPPPFLMPPPALMLPPPVTPLLHSSAPSPFPHLRWPVPPFPTFPPHVPPPDYVPLQENPHRITADKVLEVLVDELKFIIKKDITRRMIECIAFKSFEDWWDCQERKAKVQSSSFKSAATCNEARCTFINTLSRGGEKFRKPPLPSFKVKRKGSEEVENQACSDKETADTNEKAKRRHARPLELDSDDDDDDDEGKEEDKALQEEETVSQKEESIVPVKNDHQILPDRNDSEDDDDDDEDSHGAEDESKLSQKQLDDETTPTADDVQISDSENLSESSSSEESQSESSDFESSDSFSSESFEDSLSDLSTDDEDTEDDSKSEDCILISSDEEPMELEPPHTPAAPLTPDPGLQDWSDLLQGEQSEEEQDAACQQDTCDLKALMELQRSDPRDLQPPSPIGLAGVESCCDMEMNSPEWSLEIQESVVNLRPVTPTGCLVDTDSDLLVKSKPSSPAEEEAERPQTPGRGIVIDLESDDSDESDEVLSQTSSENVLPTSDALAATSPVYQKRPRTPGREETFLWTNCSSVGAPATPGREILASEGSPVLPRLGSPPAVLPQSTNAYVAAPKTPGRDIKLSKRNVVHKRKIQALSISQSWIFNFGPGSPVTASSPCSLSGSSCDLAEERGAWMSSGVRTRPLQGLENMPGIFSEGTYALRRKHWLRRRRRARHRHRSHKRSAGSVSLGSRPHCQERRILHCVWKDGLDEEDAVLLKCSYERLQDQDHGLGWLSEVLWIPHPLTKVLTENSEEATSWLPRHRTGCARTEGFYKISREDKMSYLNNVRSPTQLPSTSAQGACIPAQQSTSLRAGSDFRSEQRRLLSSFSCDSDLVKFNQLKFRKKRIRFSRSHIHEWGLFAMEPIAADEMVIEYVGQIIRQVTADTREQRYEEEGIGSSYLFRVDDDTIIDATKLGNLARFINHSCNPNCYAKIITVDSEKKIVIYSRQPIGVNEEITYDYKFPIEETKIPCLCGEYNCRGSLN